MEASAKALTPPHSLLADIEILSKLTFIIFIFWNKKIGVNQIKALKKLL